MKMTYTAAEVAALHTAGISEARFHSAIADGRVKEMRAAAKRGMTVEEMRAAVARKNKFESLTIKKARLEKRLAEVTAELEKFGI